MRNIINDLIEVSGIEEPSCSSCVYLRRDTDGDYGEIDCGRSCALLGITEDENRLPSSSKLKNFPDIDIKKGDCLGWTPDFWMSTLSNNLTGDPKKDHQVILDYHESLTDVLENYLEVVIRSEDIKIGKAEDFRPFDIGFI